MILDTTEAAAELGTTPRAVHQMVYRRQLRPLVPGAKPLRFGLLEVAEAQVRRMTPDEHRRLDSLAARLAQDETVCEHSA